MTDTVFETLPIEINETWREWQTFIANSPCGSFFLSHGWLHAIATGMNHDIRLHILRDDSGILVGAVVRHAKKFMFNAGRKPWATAYNGPLISPRCKIADRVEFARQLLKQYDDLRLVHHPESTQAPLTPVFKFKTAHTAVLNLTDLDSLWKGFNPRVRQRVRKAEKLGVRTEETNDSETFYYLYCMTYQNHQLKMPLSLKQVQTTLDLACSNAQVRIFNAYIQDGHPAASLVVGSDKRRVYFLLAGSHPEYRKTDAMTHMWWHVLKKYAETHREADLIGMGVESVDQFKKTFKPNIQEHLDTLAYSKNPKGILLRLNSKLKSIR